KIQRHEALSTSQPPRIGPSSGAISIGTPRMPITRPIRWGPAFWVMIVITDGMIIPPPSPCRIRKPISEVELHARPDSTDPSVNSTSEVRYRRLVPNRSDAHPEIGITVASANV